MRAQAQTFHQRAPITLQAAQSWTSITLPTCSQSAAARPLQFHLNTLTVAGSGNTTISGVLGSGGTPTGGLTMAGSGTLTLNGAAVNAYTGATTVNGGTLLLDFSNLATPTNLINSGSALACSAAGTFRAGFNGNSSGSTAQTLGNETVNAGGGQILVNPKGGAGTTLSVRYDHRQRRRRQPLDRRSRERGNRHARDHLAHQ